MAEEERDDDKPVELPILTSKHIKKSKSRKSKPNLIPSPHTEDHVATPRDPRFDPRCSGSNDRRHFVRNYAFLNEVKQKELQDLQKALRKENDGEKKEKIKMAIARFRNKMIDPEHEFNPKKKRGKIKKVELAEKFKDLKESGKLTKYMERKRKKLLKKDQKSFA